MVRTKRAFYMLMCTLSTVNRSLPRASSESKIAGKWGKKINEMSEKEIRDQLCESKSSQPRDCLFCKTSVFRDQGVSIHSSGREMIFLVWFSFCSFLPKARIFTIWYTIFNCLRKARREKTRCANRCVDRNVKCEHRTRSGILNSQIPNILRLTKKFSMSVYIGRKNE